MPPGRCKIKQQTIIPGFGGQRLRPATALHQHAQTSASAQNAAIQNCLSANTAAANYLNICHGYQYSNRNNLPRRLPAPNGRKCVPATTRIKMRFVVLQIASAELLLTQILLKFASQANRFATVLSCHSSKSRGDELRHFWPPESVDSNHNLAA